MNSVMNSVMNEIIGGIMVRITRNMSNVINTRGISGIRGAFNKLMKLSLWKVAIIGFLIGEVAFIFVYVMFVMKAVLNLYIA